METAKETVTNLINSASNMIYGDTSATNTTTTTGDDTTTATGDDTTTATAPASGGHNPQDTLLGDEGKGYLENPDAHKTAEPAPAAAADSGTSGSSGADSGSVGADDATKGSSSSTSAPSDPSSTAVDTSAASSGASANAAADVGHAPPESGAAPEAHHQGGANPTREPDAKESAAISDKKEAVEESMDQLSGKKDGSTTEDTSATGAESKTATSDSAPKSLIGDAAPAPSDSTGGAAPVGGAAGGAGGVGAGPKPAESKSTEQGTGEKYIKSSGTQADGGDFDAANAGAGREADRLLEEKGFHRDAGNTGPPEVVPGNEGSASAASDSAAAPGEKVSLGQKIKDKLHIGSKDKP